MSDSTTEPFIFAPVSRPELPEDKKNLIMADTLANLKTKDEKKIILDFIGHIETFYKEHKFDEMMYLCDNIFPVISKELFQEKEWSKLSTMKETLKMTEFTKSMYRYLSKRHSFSSESKNEIKDYLISYSSIVKLLNIDYSQNVGRDSVLTFELSWSILNDLINQFHGFCDLRGQMENEADKDYGIVLLNDEFPSYTTIISIIDNLIKKGGILEKDGSLSKNLSEPSTPKYLAAAAYLAKIKLFVNHGQHAEAFALLNRIGLDAMLVYQNVWDALIELLYLSGIEFFVHGKFVYAAHVFERIIILSLKFGHHHSKYSNNLTLSFIGAGYVEKLINKSRTLLLVANSSLSMDIDETVRNALGEEERKNSERLRISDYQVLENCLSKSIPKQLIPITDVESYTNYSFKSDGCSLQQEFLKKSIATFKAENNLRQVSRVLSTYGDVSLSFFAKTMGVDTTEAKELIRKFNETRNPQPSADSGLEQLLFSRRNLDNRQITVTEEGDNLHASEAMKLGSLSETLICYSQELSKITSKISKI